MTKTFCGEFRVEKPVVLAPMAGIVTPALVAAVSNSGGLGLAPLWHVDVEELRSSVREISRLTDKPFGVNLNMDFPSQEHLDACLEGGVSIFSFFWHLNEDYIQKAKSAGAKVIFTAGSAADAAQAVQAGADAICAQGWEAGGHVRGTVGTMSLVPAVKDLIGDVPVIAAGGISDGRGMAAALALGASAVWVGTRFIAAFEAFAHPEYLRCLFAASEDDTAHFQDLFNVGWEDAAHRVLKNSTVKVWEAAGRPPHGKRPGEDDVVCRSKRSHDIVRYQAKTPEADLTGDIEAISMWAGQSVFHVKKQQAAADIIDEMLAEAAATLKDTLVV